jgi:hypothetical protein
MDNLHQVLIINPKFSFSEIAHVMKSMGWQYDALDLGTAPLIDNEPEVATWSWFGNKPFITYTFNPVVKMRVLDVAGVPPRLRDALGRELPLVDREAIESLFESDDIRARLLGLWAAQEIEAVEFIGKARQLTQDKEKVLAEEAGRVCDRLEKINRARTEVMVQMRIMEEATPALIRQLNDPEFVKTLKPTHSDLQQLFDAELVELANDALTKIYADGSLCINVDPHGHIKPTACPAGLLRWPNMLSNQFPGGYRDLAGWMNPSRIWVCWKVETSVTKVSYDGLVWLGDHWCWLPKIFRALGPYLLSGSSTATRH